MAAGTVLAGQGQGLGAGMRYEHLESLVAREVAKNAGVVRVVLDDEQNGFAIREVVAVVLDARFLLGRGDIGEEHGRGRGHESRPVGLDDGRHQRDRRRSGAGRG